MSTFESISCSFIIFKVFQSFPQKDDLCNIFSYIAYIRNFSYYITYLNLSTLRDSSGYNLYNKEKSQNFRLEKFANVKKYLVLLELPNLKVDKSKKIVYLILK